MHWWRIVGWKDINGKSIVEYDYKLSLTFRDIWSDVFGLKSDFRNTYYKVCSEELQPRRIKILEAIKDKAEAYYETYSMIHKRWKELQEFITEEVHKIELQT